MDGLTALLGHATAQRFFADYFEVAVYRDRQCDPLNFSRYAELVDFDRLIADAHGKLPSAFVRVKRDGQYLPAQDYTRVVQWDTVWHELVDAERVLAHYDQGNTIVFSALERSLASVGELCASLRQTFRRAVHANAYLSPPNGVAGKKHYDSHDTFILQLRGKKRWQIYCPEFELPHERQSQPLKPGVPQQDFVLEAGGLLYIPRGFPHETATQGDMSLHLTIGMDADWTWQHLCQAAVARVASADARWRQTIPVEGPTGLREQYAAFLAQLARLNPEELMDAQREAFADGQPADFSGRLVSAAAADGIDEHTPLRVRVPEQARMSEGNGVIDLHWSGKRVSLSARYRQTAQDLVAWGNRPLTAASLSHEPDPDLRLGLARFLLREGYLTVMG